MRKYLGFFRKYFVLIKVNYSLLSRDTNWLLKTSGVPIIYILTVLIMGDFSRQQPLYLQNILVGSLIIGMWVSNIILTSFELRKELSIGNIQNLLLSQTSLYKVILSRGVMYSGLGNVPFVIVLVFMSINYNLDFIEINIIALTLCILFSIINLAIVGTMLSGFSLLIKDFSALSAVLTRLIFILSGAMVPISLMPPAVQYFSYLLSPMWIVQLFQGVANHSMGTIEIINSVIIILFISVIYIYISKLTFNKIENLYMKNKLNEV